MRKFLTGLACLAMVTSAQASAQERENAAAGRQQAQGQQTIRGTVAGVTTAGEAVVDPQTSTAVAVQVNYLTVLGSPSQNRQGTAGSTQGSQSDQPNPGGRSTPAQRQQANQGRQNLYLVAISPQTQIRHQQQGNQTGTTAAGASQQKAAFDHLEIGDRVEVQFKSTGRLLKQSGAQRVGNQQSQRSDQTDTQQAENPQGAQEQTTGFRGNPASSKHGRNRIYVGEASQITILSADQQRGQGSQPGSGQRTQGSNQ